MLFFVFLSRFFFDILRDKNTRKYSTTKVVAVSTTLFLFVAFTVGIVIMYQKQETDHILIGEMITFILTLLGFKNFKNPNAAAGIDVPVEAKPESKKETKPSVEEGVF